MRFTDPDGMWPNTNVLYGSINKTLNEFAAVRSQHPNWSNARVLGTTMLNRTVDAAAFTDANDAVVVGTTFTRGSNAINIDGTKATTGDKIAAFAGLALPAISGSAIKKAFGAIEDALGIANKADNVGGARFVGDTDGKLIDTETTPRGSYTQPDGSRTDVLQEDSHYNKATKENHGTSHTHETFSNTNPNTGETRTGVSRTTHRPTYDEVKNIEEKKAKIK